MPPIVMRFTVNGTIRGKQTARRAKFGGVYTPQQTVDAMAAVRAAFLDAFGQVEPLHGAVDLEIVVRQAMPKSWSQRRRDQTRYCACVRKPDGANVRKLVEDALNKVAWDDDVQVASYSDLRVWDDESKMQITITDRSRDEGDGDFGN